MRGLERQEVFGGSEAGSQSTVRFAWTGTERRDRRSVLGDSEVQR